MEARMTTKTVRNIEKTSETAQKIARTAQDTGHVVTDYVVKSQELNTRLTQRVFEAWTDVLRRQTELTQDMAQELFEKAEDQTSSFQSLFGQWTSGFARFPHGGVVFDPFGWQRQVLRLAETTTRNVQTATVKAVEVAGTAAANGGFPIAGYDEMNVNEVSQRLDDLTVEELKKVLEYEKHNKNRDTVIDQLDRKIKTSS
jgi:hypothetical protein